MARREVPRGSLLVEFVRLSIVLVLTAIGFTAAPAVTDIVGNWWVEDADLTEVRLITSMLGALAGYVLGGIAGRAMFTGVDRAEEHVRRVETPVLVAAVLGAVLAGLAGALTLWPIALLVPVRLVGIPLVLALFATLVYIGARLGAARGGDLLRYMGARGRVRVETPSRGRRVKLVDTSALIDGRVIDVARAGFLDGVLVVPRFVLEELQSLADVGDRRRRNAARRGLDNLKSLQEEELLAVEVTDDDDPAFDEVDAKLASLARERDAALLTVDSNLARVAEISGVRVLNLHTLAEALRPPVIPGERLVLNLAKEGREEGQGVGYLPDGTMVVVEDGLDHVGEQVAAEVTSLLQTRNGRMVFARLILDDGQTVEAPEGAP